MEPMENVAEFVRRASEKTGFVREKYIEGKLPTNFSSFIAVPFFGDQKHEFILSAFLLHRLKEEMPSKYIVVCGWPGHAALFPYADEYWGIKDGGAVKAMLSKTEGFDNTEKRATFFHQQLNRFFETISPETFKTLYDNGFTSKFFERFKFIVYKLPGIAGLRHEQAGLISSDKPRIFMQPSKMVESWARGKVKKVPCKQEFWEQLIESLVEDYLPVVKQDASTYDLSVKLADKAYFVGEMKAADQLALMRACCVLDVCNGTSKWALMARTPFINMTERNLHIEGKNYELDDLCCGNLPHCYIFTFATMLEGSDYINLVDLALAKIKDFVPKIDPSQLPNTTETSVVLPYLMVREQKAKRFGTKFFKIERI